MNGTGSDKKHKRLSAIAPDEEFVYDGCPCKINPVGRSGSGFISVIKWISGGYSPQSETIDVSAKTMVQVEDVPSVGCLGAPKAAEDYDPITPKAIRYPYEPVDTEEEKSADSFAIVENKEEIRGLGANEVIIDEETTEDLEDEQDEDQSNRE